MSEKQGFMKAFQANKRGLPFQGAVLARYNTFVKMLLYTSTVILLDPGVREPVYSLRMEPRFNDERDVEEALQNAHGNDALTNELAHMVGHTEKLAVGHGEWAKTTGQTTRARWLANQRKSGITDIAKKELHRASSHKTHDKEQLLKHITLGLATLHSRLEVASKRNYQVCPPIVSSVGWDTTSHIRRRSSWSTCWCET